MKKCIGRTIMIAIMVLSILFSNIGGNFAYANGTTEEIPTVTNADPDYPWLGYDAYTKGYPNYDPMNGSGSVFTQYATNPSVEGEELNKAILRVLYNGYPNNANGIMNGIEPLNAILVTQNAIWHYSDSQKKDYDKWASQYDTTLEQKNLMTAAIKKLVSANLDEVVTKKVPLTYKLNLFISKDSAYQHLLSADAVPDTPKMPSDRGGDVVEPENPKGDDSKEDSTKSTFKATKMFINKVEKGTGTVVKDAQLTIFKGEDKKDKVGEPWKTTDTKHAIDINSLEEGQVYVLSETGVPDGYTQANDIFFKVQNGKVFVKKGETYEEVKDLEEIGGENYEAFADRNDSSFSWGTTPYGKHYYLRDENTKGQVLYCFNIDKHEPAESDDEGESINYMDIQSMKEIYLRYTKYVGKEKLITYAQTPRIKNATDFYSKVQKVISAGYPSNTLKLQTEDMEGNKNITDTAFKTVTQLAIYYYTDSIDLDTIEHGWVTEKDQDHVLHGLEVGKKYTFHEAAAPKGLEVVMDFVFSVDKEGKVTVHSTITNGKVEYKDGKLIVTDDRADVSKKQNDNQSKKLQKSQQGPNSSGSTGKSVHKTGDSRVLWLYGVMLTVSGLVLLAIVWTRKKNHNNGEA